MDVILPEKISSFLDLAVKNIGECKDDMKFRVGRGFLIQPVTKAKHRRAGNKEGEACTFVSWAGAIVVKVMGFSPTRKQERIWKLPNTTLWDKNKLIGLSYLSMGRFADAEESFRVRDVKYEQARAVGKGEGLSGRPLTARIKEILGDDIPNSTHLSKFNGNGKFNDEYGELVDWNEEDRYLELMQLQTMAEFYRGEGL